LHGVRGSGHQTEGKSGSSGYRGEMLSHGGVTSEFFGCATVMGLPKRGNGMRKATLVNNLNGDVRCWRKAPEAARFIAFVPSWHRAGVYPGGLAIVICVSR
jgi:hypothetical protein